MQEILAKLSEFNITKFQMNANVIKLQIKLKPNQNANAQEEMIKQLLPNYNVQVVFFMEETKRLFKKVIGISSGKGGVGKSSIALHLAYNLKEKGFKVGILDADIYAPSIPVFLGVSENPRSIDGRLIDPVRVKGFQLLSMGLFLQHNQTTMWRPNILAAAFHQFLEQANWDCDYLIIDFPPGITDIHMSCSKLIPDIEFLLVTTPSKVAYSDVMRMYVFLRSMNLRIAGLVENMACIKCLACGHVENFNTTAKIDVKLITRIPIIQELIRLAEDGYPENYVQCAEKEWMDMIAASVV